MTVPLLDLKRQFSRVEADVRRRMDTVIAGQSFILGKSVQEFEEAVCQYLGVEHAVGVASGTDAILLPLKALVLRPGDEVIAPSFTFFATAGAIHNAGGRPVFVDIEPNTFNISVAEVEKGITPRTRAIVPVHLFGQMADMVPLRDLADEHGLMLLEDAAQAIGAAQQVNGQWKKTGQLGHVAAFSFFPSKNLGCFGDGGMVVTEDPDIAERIRRLRVHGGKKMYHHQDVGTNSRLDALQAAVLHAKLPYLEAWSRERAENAAWYDRRFAALEDAGHLRRPVVREYNTCIYNQYTLRVQRRDALRQHLSEWGIGNAVYYPVPLHLQECFSSLGYERGTLPESEKASEEVLSIPVFPELTEEEREAAATAIEEFYS